MLFNSITFLIFLPIVFGGYWLLRERLRWQNFLIVVASYVFYGWWDWRFLVLIAFTSLWAFAFGLLPRTKVNVAISFIINLGILGFFKYYNFFVDSCVAVLSAFGVSANPSSLQIILPVGISFYTFQALSYTLDVYRGTIKPTKDPIAFFAFISFFPQLVAGPIERATNLLPQFLAPRRFDYSLAVEGCRQMLWGFFKKILVADTCAVAANTMLGNANPSSISLALGMVAFSFQIYGDFSGYSDIAIGCSKLFGIRLMRNFAYPYFSRDIAEFWRRWHISLTTWFRDYLYIPLGGSRCSKLKVLRNTFVIFAVSGLWHGANWTFIVWGLFHALCFLPLILRGKNRTFVGSVVAEQTIFPRFKDLCGIAMTFLLAFVGWTFFRAPDITTAWAWLVKIFSFTDLHTAATGVTLFLEVLKPLSIHLVWEWISRRDEIIRFPNNRVLRWIVYWVLVCLIACWQPAAQQFIYFQF